MENLDNPSSVHLFSDKTQELDSYNEKIANLVKALRSVSKQEGITERDVQIPEFSEKFGFVRGRHNLGQMLYFLADMLEE